MPKKIDLTGQRFGRWVVLGEAPKKKGEVRWYCKCDCGNTRDVTSSRLRQGISKSCGCFKSDKIRETHTKHGLYKSPVYKIWQNMTTRCYNPNTPYYPYYGGRGIGVCGRWLGENGFQNFYEDIGKYWQKGLTLDRKDTNGHYEPSNCRWATDEEQVQNSRGLGYFWHKGAQKWAAHITVSYQHIHLGLFDTPEEARQAYIEAKWKYHGVWLDE